MKIVIVVIIFLGFNSRTEVFAQTTTVVSKRCGKCSKPVSNNSKIGDICPHCGVRWGYENSTTTSRTVTQPNYTDYIDIFSPSTATKSKQPKKSPTKSVSNSTLTKPNPFASYSRAMTEDWLMQRFKSNSRKKISCPTDAISSIGGCKTYDDYEFKFADEYLIVKYNYNNEYNEIVYVPLYDFYYVYGQSFGSSISISTTSNTMSEVNKKYNSTRVIDYLNIGFKNDAETNLIENIEFALNRLKKLYRKPSSSLPEFISQSELNKPSLSETQNWVLSKLNSYQQNLTNGNYSTSSSWQYSNFTYTFVDYNLIINFKETSNLTALGNNNTWTNYYTVTVPLCECSIDRPSNFRGAGDRSYGGGNLRFSSSSKNLTKTEQGVLREYLASFDVNIDFERESDLQNRIQKAFNNIKSFCPAQTKSREAF